MSPAKSSLFSIQKKAIHEGVPRADGRGRSGRRQTIAASRAGGRPRVNSCDLESTHMNAERYVGDSKMHEMVAIAMEEDWDVCVTLCS